MIMNNTTEKCFCTNCMKVTDCKFIRVDYSYAKWECTECKGIVDEDFDYPYSVGLKNEDYIDNNG